MLPHVLTGCQVAFGGAALKSCRTANGAATAGTSWPRRPFVSRSRKGSGRCRTSRSPAGDDRPLENAFEPGAGSPCCLDWEVSSRSDRFPGGAAILDPKAHADGTHQSRRQVDELDITRTVLAVAVNQPSPDVATTTASQRAAEPIAPTASRLLPLLVIAPVVAAAVRWGRPHYLETPVSAAALTLLCVVVFGLPALFWALDHGRIRLIHLATLGAGAGLLAPCAILAAGILGQFTYGDWSYVRRALDHGATLPWYGLLRWTAFGGLAAASAITGAVSGIVYWLVFLPNRYSRVGASLMTLGALAAGAGVSMLLP